jgi:methylmalonyl-CoA/ethylmalonyl-CoA epimerase
MSIPRALAESVFQIAYVVPDLHSAVRFFKEELGVPCFLIKEDIRGEDQTYLGRPGDFRHSIAFGYAGQMQIELIQSLSGASTYADFLAQHPRGGVHHLGLLVDDYDAGVGEMNGRGFKLVQSGRNGETRFAYFDVGHPIGTLLEIVRLAPAIKAAFERLKRGEA